MSVLENLIDRNAYPIVFIGSGMSMRYAKDFPNWNGLILYLWKKAFQDEKEENYYKFMLQLREEILKKYPESDPEFVSYKLNIDASSIIESKFNELFREGKIVITNYTAKDYFEKGISPFKMEVANMFSNLDIKSDMKQEFEVYKKFLSKTKIILTTNYDEMIEKAYNSVVGSHSIDT